MLTSKQRAILRGKANTMDPVFIVGKGEIDETMIQGVKDCLDARELIKLKVLESSMYNAREASVKLAEATGADCVQVIGSKFVLYLQKKKDSAYADLLEEVPIDSARFLFNMHDAGSGIDFDLDQAVKTDNDNPVYYVQYAHARICSILKKMESEGVAFAGAENIDATLLTEPSEMDLIRMLAAFPQEIVMAAEKYDPSRINRFVIDLASAFHRFYGSCRIQGADPAVQQARLALCIGVKNAIFNVLTMFKINVPEKM